MVNDKFLKNWLGIKLSDDEMREIPFPGLEFGLHVSLKCMQAGSIGGYFGSRLYLGYKAFIKKEAVFARLNSMELTEYSCRMSRNVMFCGLILSIPMVLLNYEFQNKIGNDVNYERAYRIRYDESELNFQRGSLLIATIYGTLFSLSNKSFLLGFPKGLCWGTILAATYDNFNQARRVKQSIYGKLYDD